MNKLAREYLDLATLDVASAMREAGVVDIPNPAIVCFCAQQSAEKTLKALLTERMITFPRTHDLFVLLELLADSGLKARVAEEDLHALMPGAVQLRYPGVYVSMHDAQTALDACVRVRAVLLEAIGH